VSDDDTIVLRAARWVDVEAGKLCEGAVIVVEGNRIAAVNPDKPPANARAIDLGDVTLLPGLMDMEINMLMGGPSGGNPRADVQDDPAFKLLRAVVNCKTTLLAGFTTVRNLGLFVKTGGYLLDVALGRAIDNGWIDGPRIVSAGHAITPDGRPPRSHDVPALCPRTCCPSASRRASPTACPRCARPSATRSSTAWA
jgi:imidazolonepropionase-like amidohydrolase